jgi:hypothetical protein
VLTMKPLNDIIPSAAPVHKQTHVAQQINQIT